MLFGLQALCGQLGMDDLGDFNILSGRQHCFDMGDQMNLGVRILTLGEMRAIVTHSLVIVARIAGLQIIGRANLLFSGRPVVPQSRLRFRQQNLIFEILQTLQKFGEFEKSFVVAQRRFERVFGVAATRIEDRIQATVGWYRAHPASK